ncbi:hypothetical protein GCM10010917_27450 [Paenibacillus physcomitrellae]|uniref:Uncharacterized protein n=1 Tax=Paenibacillus physcomitrellae TaxID=1619311 RepID=A0ABQ1GBW7_9BACL|nr:hypothetical protein GCM10010917_27450 [Paenibacillus physcomitrellae]
MSPCMIRLEWKEGNEITLIDILGSDNDDDIMDDVELKWEKSKIYQNLDILDERKQSGIKDRFGLKHGGEERTQREIAKEFVILIRPLK